MYHQTEGSHHRGRFQAGDAQVPVGVQFRADCGEGHGPGASRGALVEGACRAAHGVRYHGACTVQLAEHAADHLRAGQRGLVPHVAEHVAGSHRSRLCQLQCRSAAVRALQRAVSAASVCRVTLSGVPSHVPFCLEVSVNVSLSSQRPLKSHEVPLRSRHLEHWVQYPLVVRCFRSTGPVQYRRV